MIDDALVLKILNAPRMHTEFSGDLREALNCGFSYGESEDHMVSYVLGSPVQILQIIRSIEETTLNLEQGFIGDLWTAKMLCSKKVPDNRVIFANESLLTILSLDIVAEHKDPDNARV